MVGRRLRIEKAGSPTLEGTKFPAVLKLRLIRTRSKDEVLRTLLRGNTGCGDSSGGQTYRWFADSCDPRQTGVGGGKMNLAEGVGFEPTNGLPRLLISSQVHSTTLPPFRVGADCNAA